MGRTPVPCLPSPTAHRPPFCIHAHMGIKCFIIEPTEEKTPEGHTIYRRMDTGEKGPYLNPGVAGTPVGAMWWCDWLGVYGYKRSFEKHLAALEANLEPHRYFPDESGRILAVMTPGGTWIIDSRASNCALPHDNIHHCWVRHGIPPLITVDKAGVTCAAGAGSIHAGKWHGYLREGELVEA